MGCFELLTRMKSKQTDAKKKKATTLYSTFFVQIDILRKMLKKYL